MKFFLSPPVFSKWENPSSFHCSPPPPFFTSLHQYQKAPASLPMASPQHSSAADTPDPPLRQALNHQQRHSWHSQDTAEVLFLSLRANIHRFWACPKFRRGTRKSQAGQIFTGLTSLEVLPHCNHDDEHRCDERAASAQKSTSMAGPGGPWPNR